MKARPRAMKSNCTERMGSQTMVYQFEQSTASVKSTVLTNAQLSKPVSAYTSYDSDRHMLKQKLTHPYNI
jgi:hypothetical protein